MRGAAVSLTVSIMIGLLLFAPEPVCAKNLQEVSIRQISGKTNLEDNDELPGTGDELLDQMDLNTVRRPSMNFWLMRMFLFADFWGINEGRTAIFHGDFKTAVFSLLNSSWSTQQKLWMNLLILVLAAALLPIFPPSLSRGQLGEMSFSLSILLFLLCLSVIFLRSALRSPSPYQKL